MERTTYCGLVSKDYLNEKVTLKGWVQKRRDLGGIIFLDLRDREGVVQIMVNSETSPEAWAIADKVRTEFVVEIQGKVIARNKATINPDMKTGEIEVEASDITILNKSKNPPFMIEEASNVSQDLRGEYRYLDLRRPEMLANLRLRHKTTKAIRDFLDGTGFIDVETPFLTKSTPEGARDYLVPSRVHPGEFYALPQSPQLFKQLLMASGFDRYYQIVRCFRDEDLRGDRQPEFTQLDIETSFLSAEEIQSGVEELLAYVLKETKGIDLPVPFERMSYDYAMDHYGSDKPDLRFDMPLINVSDAIKDSPFKVFSGTIADGGMVKALNVKGAADSYSRKDIEALEEFVAIYGAKGLAWMKVSEEGLTGPIAKFFKETPEGDEVVKAMDAEAGDLLLFVAAQPKVVHDALGALRVRLGKELQLFEADTYRFVWIVDWPLFEYDEDAERYVAAHHPFTMPKEEDLERLETAPETVYANAYDVVLNGYEIGGGSLRIHTREVQEAMFRTLGFTEDEYTEQFGFLIDAMNYGFPPHGGIAFGLDRLVMILAGENNIREVIAFPKNSSAIDPMTEAPSVVDAAQLEELGLEVTTTEQEEE